MGSGNAGQAPLNRNWFSAPSQAEEATMLVKALSEGEPFRCAGNEYFMLLPRDISDCCEVVLEKVPPGHSTPPNAHSTFVQV